MPLMSKYDQAEMTRYIIINAEGMSDEKDIDAILTDFDAALTDIEAHKSDKGVSYQQICLEIKGVAPQLGLSLGAHIIGDPNDPWTLFCPAFWDKAITISKFQGQIYALLKRILDIVAKNNATFGCLYENSNTQFGEALLTHLALRDKRFVPHFTDFLWHWDLDHQVTILDARSKILEVYGTCDETARLED